jgi:hypothetical protein
VTLATCQTYDDLIEALRARKDALGISNNELDAIAGTPAGYAGKIFGAARVRALGPQSFEYFLGALGLRFQLVEDAEATARIRARLENGPRLMKGVHQNGRRNRTLKDSLRRMAIRYGRKGGKASAEKRMKLTKKQRSEQQRKAALNGWKKRRAVGAAIERSLDDKVS